MDSRFDTPERAIRFIRADRTRRSWIAAAAGAIAIIVTLGAIYLVYRDVPAPQSPANATMRLLEPYH
jgi:hypothetical protein